MAGVFENYNCISLRPNSKKPSVSSFSTTEMNPKPNDPNQFALICGKSSDNIYVIDFDGRKDESGMKKPVSLDFVKEIFPDILNRTLVVRTPSGGYHVYLIAYDEMPPRMIDAFSNDKVQIDICGQGGFVVAPPSKTQNGQYEIISNITEIAKMSYKGGAALRLEEFFPKRLEHDGKNYDKIGKEGSKEGSRHKELVSYCNHLRAVNPEWDKDTMFLALTDWAKKSNYNDEKDIRKVIDNVFTFQENKSEKEDSDYKISKVTTVIESEYHFKSTSDIAELFYYRKGFYTNKGSENFVKALCEKTFKEPSSYKCNEVIHAIKRRNFVEREELDGDPNILNFENGLFNIDNVKLSEHTPEYFSRNQFSFEYDENAKCPVFDKFLESSLPDEVKRENILEDMASCFLPQINLKKIILYVGEGYNGKSVLTNVLTKMLGGKDNVSNVSLKQFSRPFSMANLEGKLANIHSDIDKGSVGSLADLKVASSEDPLFIERKGKDGYTIEQKPKLIFACNQPPTLDEDTVAIYGRLRITEWEEEFLPNNPKTDPDITNKILDEFSGIFNKLVPYIIKLKQNKKFTNEESVEDIEEKYLLKAQSSMFYAKNNLEIDNNSKTVRTEIYDDYKGLCKKFNVRKESPTSFYKTVEKELGITHKKERVSGNSVPCWNVKIKDNEKAYQEFFK